MRSGGSDTRCDRSATRLGDHLVLQRGTTYKSALLGTPGPYLLGLASIERNGGFRWEKLRTYGGDSPEKLLLRPGDLYVSLKDVTQSGDLLGAVARVPGAIQLGRLTQDTVKLEISAGVPTTDYLYWLLRTPQYRDYCRSHSMGTTNLSLSRADFLAFPVPPLTPNRKSVLLALQAVEHKIDSNRRLAKRLEDAAGELFRARFVDFVGVEEFDESEFGRIPNGWEAGRLGDLVRQRKERCRPSETTAALPYVPIDVIPARSFMLSGYRPGDEAQSSLTTFEPGDILFGAMRPYFHKVAIAPFHGTTRTTVFVLRAVRSEDWAYTALLLSQAGTVEFATRTSRGSTIPYAVWDGVLSEMAVVIPPADERVTFDDVVRPLLAQVQNIGFEQSALGEIRDLLLPKLISGQIRVPDTGDPEEVLGPVAATAAVAAR